MSLLLSGCNSWQLLRDISCWYCFGNCAVCVCVCVCVLQWRDAERPTNSFSHLLTLLTDFCWASHALLTASFAVFRQHVTFIMLAACSVKRTITVWRPSVCLYVPFFSNLNRALCAYSTWLTRGQHVTRPAYISVRVLKGRTYGFWLSWRV